MSEVLWSKLGTEAETYVLLDRYGTLVAGMADLNAYPRDLARFAMMMLNGGEVDGEQVVATDIVEMLERGGDREAFTRGPEATGAFATDWSYRAQWWIRHNGAGGHHRHRRARPVDLHRPGPQGGDHQTVLAAGVLGPGGRSVHSECLRRGDRPPELNELCWPAGPRYPQTHVRFRSTSRRRSPVRGQGASSSEPQRHSGHGLPSPWPFSSVRKKETPVFPCAGDPDLWFAEEPVELERAKAMWCRLRPIARQCLAAALERAEPWGVWGGEILVGGAVLARKRPRGRPRKDVVAA